MLWDMNDEKNNWKLFIVSIMEFLYVRRLSGIKWILQTIARLWSRQGWTKLKALTFSWYILFPGYLMSFSRTSVSSSRGKCGITVLAYSYMAMFLTQVKPAMPYLDVIRLLRDNTSLPISAYQVRISLHQISYKCSQLSQCDMPWIVGSPRVQSLQFPLLVFEIFRIEFCNGDSD